MTNFTLTVAGIPAAVTCQFDTTPAFCGPYLCGTAPAFSVTLTPADIALEREKSAREDALEGLPPREYSDAYLETIALQRKLAEAFFDRDILLFHGSVVAVDGEAYLFTAKSGTGKSTHTRLWREMLGEKAVMVNDDKPFLEIGDRGITVHGSPWNGKHGLGTNISVPLKAICILERGEENQIRPITAQQALTMLVQQSNRPQNPAKMPKYLELLDKLANNVEFYYLKCNMHPEAAQVAYEAMQKAFPRGEGGTVKP